MFCLVSFMAAESRGSNTITTEEPLVLGILNTVAQYNRSVQSLVSTITTEEPLVLGILNTVAQYSRSRSTKSVPHGRGGPGKCQEPRRPLERLQES